MNKAGVKLNETEQSELLRMAERAKNAPVMTVRSDIPDFATAARNDLQKRVHELALAHGLPDGSFYYGCDLTTGEILVPQGYEKEFESLKA